MGDRRNSTTFSGEDLSAAGAIHRTEDFKEPIAAGCTEKEDFQNRPTRVWTEFELLGEGVECGWTNSGDFQTGLSRGMDGKRRV